MLGKLGKLAKTYSTSIKNPKKFVKKLTGRQGKGLLGQLGKVSQKKLGAIPRAPTTTVFGRPPPDDGASEGTSKLDIAIKVFKWIVIIVLIILLLIALIPIVPYWMITYYSFWGRYGILRLARNNFRNF